MTKRRYPKGTKKAQTVHPVAESRASTSTPANPAPITGKKGIYSEYLDRQMTQAETNVERQLQLRRISEIRGSAVLSYAADSSKGQKGAPVSVDPSDLIAIADQVDVLTGDRLDLVLETPGGSGEVAEDIVKLLRSRFKELNIIVPGTAKSAGTIIAMAGDEILMEEISSLGPIDAQINHRGKWFSADALIQGLEDIKAEVITNGSLNQAYIPILQNMSPGEIKNASNVMEFARELVRDWLFKFKFKNWNVRKRDGSAVTDAHKIARASKIADELSKHTRWKTHGRSIKIDDLREMELEITDYSLNEQLADAIRRYRVLLEITFSSSAIYKIFETPESMIVKFQADQVAPQKQLNVPANVDTVELVADCAKCGKQIKLIAGIGKPPTSKLGFVRLPTSDKMPCPNCGNEINTSKVRKDLETASGRKVH